MYLTTVKSKDNNFKPVPAGTHLGRLYRIIDIGTQQGEWQGKITHQRKIILYFELFGEDETGAPLTRDDGKPLIITKYYNASLHEKSTLRKHLQTWLKIDFDQLEEPFSAKDLLGKFAMVSVSNYKSKNNELRAAVDSLAAVPAMLAKHGMPEGVNPLFMFDLEKFDSEKYASLSEGVRKMISLSPEYRKIVGDVGQPQKAAEDGVYDDDVPF